MAPYKEKTMDFLVTVTDPCVGVTLSAEYVMATTSYTYLRGQGEMEIACPLFQKSSSSCLDAITTSASYSIDNGANFVRFDDVNLKFEAESTQNTVTISTSLLSFVDSYIIKITGKIVGYTSNEYTFELEITDECLTTSITVPTIDY